VYLRRRVIPDARLTISRVDGSLLMADPRALALASDTDLPLMATKSEYWERDAKRMTEAAMRADNNRRIIDARSHLSFSMHFPFILYILF